MDNEEIFTTSFQAGRKRIYVDVKENHAGTYLKIKERGDSQSNSILIPSGSIVELRNALDEAVLALESLDASKGGGAGGASAASPANQCVCHVSNLSGLCIIQIHGAFVLNRRVDLRAIDASLLDSVSSDGPPRDDFVKN